MCEFFQAYERKKSGASAKSLFYQVTNALNVHDFYWFVTHLLMEAASLQRERRISVKPLFRRQRDQL